MGQIKDKWREGRGEVIVSYEGVMPSTSLLEKNREGG